MGNAISLCTMAKFLISH